MTSENAILYRSDDPLPREGEGRIGDVSTTADETTITTVTDANGQLVLETNNDPGLIERTQWWIDRNLNVPSIPFVGQIPAVPLPDVSGALGWVGPPQAAPTPTIDTGASAVLP